MQVVQKVDPLARREVAVDLGYAELHKEVGGDPGPIGLGGAGPIGAGAEEECSGEEDSA